MKVAICTLGCRTNIYESDSIETTLKKNGFEIVDFSDFADVYIVNTCSVTSEADKKSRQMIRKGKHINPKAYVVCLGCYSQLKYDEAQKIGADFVCGNRNKEKCIEYILDYASGNRRECIDVLDLNSTEYENCPYVIPSRETVKAYIKICDGCDNKCSYCIIREARGPVVSRSIDDIYKEGKTIVDSGFKEIIVTGTEVASYGKDTGKYSLIDVIEKLDKLDGIERVRMASIEPSVLKPDFILRLSKLKHFAPSIHLSLQSGSDKVLALMKRKYNSKMVRESIDLMRKNIKNVEFSADVICGFPQEDESDFNDTVKLCEYIKLNHAHIFPYSDRDGTVSSSMDGKIKYEIKKSRCKMLADVVNKTSYDVYSSYIGKEMSVLVEQKKGEYYVGQTENGLDSCVISESDITNTIYKGIVKEVKNNVLFFE